MLQAGQGAPLATRDRHASRTPAGPRAATWRSCTSATRRWPGSHRASSRGSSRVTLQPHQSQTVTFTITGHELSYFNTAANGWTLPDGRFSLYVGDSSALTSLPLRGKLKVTKTIGNRYVAADRAHDRQSGRDVHREGSIRQPREPADHGRHRALQVPVRVDRRPSRAHARASRCRPGRARPATSA